VSARLRSPLRQIERSPGVFSHDHPSCGDLSLVLKGGDQMDWFWFKSSYSNPSGNCVGAQRRPSSMGVRDEKDPEGPELEFDRGTWETFIRQVKEA